VTRVDPSIFNGPVIHDTDDTHIGRYNFWQKRKGGLAASDKKHLVTHTS
ncbi:uncharacterized protein METZ01_LOCUS421858, partial [marine metagenome]